MISHLREQVSIFSAAVGEPALRLATIFFTCSHILLLLQSRGQVVELKAMLASANRDLLNKSAEVSGPTAETRYRNSRC